MTTNNIDEILSTATLLDYTSEREVQLTVGDALFPEEKIDGMDLDIIKGGNDIPVSASVHALDSEAEIGEREAVKIATESLAVVKRKIRLSGKDAEILRRPRSNQEYQRKLEAIFADVDNMVRSVRTRGEAMRFEVLGTGKLVFEKENGFSGKVDYGVPKDHQSTVDISWDDENADPLQLLSDWQDIILADTGVKPTRVLTSTKVLRAVTKSAVVRSAIKGNKRLMVTTTELNDFLSSQGLPTIATEDRLYKVRQGGETKTKRFFPEDTLSLFPEGALGKLIYGTTEEEYILGEESNVDMSKVGNVVTTVSKTFDPPARWTKASAVMLPTFPTADQIYIAKVLLTKEEAETEEAESIAKNKKG